MNTILMEKTGRPLAEIKALDLYSKRLLLGYKPQPAGSQKSQDFMNQLATFRARTGN